MKIQLKERVLEVSNKDLATELKSIATYEIKGAAASWHIAEAYSRIIEQEAFTDDFGTLASFSKAVGESKSTLSRYHNAYNFRECKKLYDTAMTLNKVYELSTLGDKYEDFLQWLQLAMELDINYLSLRDIKHLIKEYKLDNEPQEEPEETEAPEQSNEPEEPEMEPDGEFANFVLNGVRYCVPWDILNQYAVK